jgi:hypothetical protein
MSKVILSLVLSVTVFAQVSWAQMASTESLLERPIAVSSQEKVSQFIAREDVVKTFNQMGVDPKSIELRIASMSNDEISEIASQIDTLPAGGDALGGIVGAAIFIFVVLLITDILGFTKVFSFTRPIR